MAIKWNWKTFVMANIALILNVRSRYLNSRPRFDIRDETFLILWTVKQTMRYLCRANRPAGLSMSGCYCLNMRSSMKYLTLMWIYCGKFQGCFHVSLALCKSEAFYDDLAWVSFVKPFGAKKEWRFHVNFLQVTKKR